MPELIDKAKIAKLCNEIEDTACDIARITMNDVISAESRMIFDKAKEIAAEVSKQPTIEAEPVRHGRCLNTDETVWDAKEIDGKQQLEISIVAARCSVCERWAEQVNNFPPYMKYDFCQHCGARMDGGADNG